VHPRDGREQHRHQPNNSELFEGRIRDLRPAQRRDAERDAGDIQDGQSRAGQV